MKKLRIAILASNFIRIPPQPKDIPPQCSGAPEYIVFLLTEELVKRGHKVTLFASGDSKTRAKLIGVTKRATGTDPDIGFEPSRPYRFYELALISKCYRMAQKGNFDLINSHIDTAAIPFAPLSETPTVTTLHSMQVGYRKFILNYFKETQYFISISNSQRKFCPSLSYVGTAYNGIECEKIPLGLKPKDYLVIAGRIHPYKGIKEAIFVAKGANSRLIIMGSHNKEDEYWGKEIKPEIDAQKIIYKGFIPREKMLEVTRKAKAFILPLRWEEPFGISMIESMACGTPVIVFNRGSVPEVVVDGKTGFIVKPNDINGMIEAVKRIYDMPESKYKAMRRACREHVEKNFTIERMVDAYEKVYQKVIKMHKAK